jgi:hypothetical protein
MTHLFPPPFLAALAEPGAFSISGLFGFGFCFLVFVPVHPVF